MNIRLLGLNTFTEFRQLRQKMGFAAFYALTFNFINIFGTFPKKLRSI